MLEKLGSTRGVGHRVGAQGWVGLESGVGFGGGGLGSKSATRVIVE